MSKIDPLIHEIPRLQICAVLAGATAVESKTLREATGISESAMSKHLKRLYEAGYISQKLGKSIGRGRPSTWVSLTEHGRSAYLGHLAALQQLVGSPSSGAAPLPNSQEP